MAACAWVAPVFAGGPLFVVPSGGTTEACAMGRHGQGLHRSGQPRSIRQRDRKQAGRQCGQAVVLRSDVELPRVIAGHCRSTSPAPTPARSSAPRTAAASRSSTTATAASSATSWARAPACSASRHPNTSQARDSTQIVEGWVIIRGEENYLIGFWPDYTPGEPMSGVVTHEFGHAIRPRAHADQWLLRAQPGHPGLGHSRWPGAGGSGPVRQGGAVPEGEPDRDDVSDDRPVPVDAELQQPADGDRPRRCG